MKWEQPDATPAALRMLTMQEITKEMARLLSKKQGAVPHFAPYVSQAGVDIAYNSADMVLPLSEFSRRVLSPAADALIKKVGQFRLLGEPLVKPEGVWDAAAETVSGVGVRGAIGYNIWSDRFIIRLDVTY